MSIHIRHAREDDAQKIATLLSSSSLPTDGVRESLQHFLVAENETGVIGAIGLEVYGDTALLRSAVVHPALQNNGIGSQLYDALLASAKTLGIVRMFLLTTTAEKYFERKGWKKIDAEGVTGPIRASVEFKGACPTTAICMELTL